MADDTFTRSEYYRVELWDYRNLNWSDTGGRFRSLEGTRNWLSKVSYTVPYRVIRVVKEVVLDA